MAGLLDILQNGGGILDFLRANSAAAIKNMPGALEADTANYGAPAPMSFAPRPQVIPANEPNAIDSAPWPQGPVGAPMSANASMPPAAPMSMAGPSPAMPPPASAAPAAEPAPQPLIQTPSTDRFSLGAKGFLGNMSAGPIGALLGGIGAAVTGQPTDAGSIGQATKVQQQRALISGLQARGVSNADITAALANPEYLKKILDNNVKDQDEFRPATPQERQAAGMTGDNNTPLFINTRTNEPKFGPAQTNVNVSTEKTGQAELAKTAVEEYKNAQLTSKDAQKRVSMYDAFERATQGFTPGATAEMRLAAKRYLKDAGLIKGEDVPDGEVMQIISRQLGVNAQPKGQGAVSNYERELFAKSLPNMTQSPEGLKMAIDISRKLEQFDMAVARIWRESAAANRGIPNYLDVQNKIADLGSPLSPGEMSAIAGGGGGAQPPAAAAAPAPTAAARPPGTYVWTPGQGLSK
jgi:hypothetical protein